VFRRPFRDYVTEKLWWRKADDSLTGEMMEVRGLMAGAGRTD
jgi:hypothetical protein